MTSVSAQNFTPALSAKILGITTMEQPLLTGKTSEIAEPGSSDAKMADIEIRATRITSILAEIRGWDHSGLNE